MDSQEIITISDDSEEEEQKKIESEDSFEDINKVFENENIITLSSNDSENLSQSPSTNINDSLTTETCKEYNDEIKEELNISGKNDILSNYIIN